MSIKVENPQFKQFHLNAEKMQGFIRLQLDDTTVIRMVKKFLLW